MCWLEILPEFEADPDAENPADEAAENRRPGKNIGVPQHWDETAGRRADEHADPDERFGVHGTVILTRLAPAWLNSSNTGSPEAA